jgi:hypothetical protein
MAGLSQNQCGRDGKEKISAPVENLIPAIQPEPSCYSARATILEAVLLIYF